MWFDILIPHKGEEINSYLKKIYLQYNVFANFSEDIAKGPCKYLCIGSTRYWRISQKFTKRNTWKIYLYRLNNYLFGRF